MSEETDNERRRMLTTVTTGVGLVGAGALAVPFVASLAPSARAKAAGAPGEGAISKLSEGQMLAVEWRGKPVWIIRRTPEMLEDLAQIREKLSDPDSEVETQQPAYAKNKYRSIKPELMVVLGVCTHLGCAPTKKFEQGKASGVSDDWVGGFFCPCHGSSFDLAGRVYRNVPAPTNLEVPPHSLLSDDRVLIGGGPEDTA